MSDEKISMLAMIENELKDKKPEEVTELLLDNCTSSKVIGFDKHSFDNLNHLSFINCDLESLEGLPELPAVKVLDLSENKLTDVSQLAKCTTNLYHLNLCGNKFESAGQLESLSQLPNLQAIDVYECPLTEKENYREDIFKAIPKLKFLDGFDVNNEEAEDLDLSGDEDAEAMSIGGLEDDEELDEEEETIGLDYLNSSKALKEDDSSADFVANGKDKTNGNGTPAATSTKRKLDEKGDSVPQKTFKKDA